MPSKLVAATSCALLLANCSTIPDLPDDFYLPIRQILLHATCELRKAFIDLNDPKYKSFGAPNWLVAVSLTPKADRQITAGAGLTGKSTIDPKRVYFNLWALGSTGAPGAQIDVKGHREGYVSFSIHSRDLINEAKFPIYCEESTPAYHALSQNLGIKDWLVRNVQAKDYTVGALAKLDKPTFTSQIYVKYSGNGSFTYTFPLGTDFASLSGNYILDEQLSIALTPDPPPSTLSVRTLPPGGQFETRKPDIVVYPSSVDPQSRLDQIQLEQTLRNLQIRVQP